MGKKFGGFGGGGANIQQLMKQAQVMQQKMAEAQAELEETEVEGSAGGGMVKVTMNCKQKVLSVSISPSVVDPDDVEMLEDLIMAAIGDASNNAQAVHEEIMEPFAGMGELM